MDLKGRHFLTLKDFTKEEIEYLVDLSAELKRKKKQGIPVDTLKGKNVALGGWFKISSYYENLCIKGKYQHLFYMKCITG